MSFSTKRIANLEYETNRCDDQRSVPTFIRSDCETCLAPLQIRVEHLGERVQCPKCGHGFTADDPLISNMSPADIDLHRRVTQFLHGRGISGLQHVRVELHGQDVSLRGRVASAHDRWLCVTCCSRVAGVARVIDELEVENSAVMNSFV